MHWLTAIYGFGSLYSLAGLGYVLAKGAERDSLVFFGIGFVMFGILAVVNEIRVRRRASKDENGRLAGDVDRPAAADNGGSEPEIKE